MSTIRHRSRRLLLGGASFAMVVAGVVGLGSAAGAGAVVVPGQGSSYAQSLYVTPKEGSLAVGVVLGEALAGHTNSFARAQSQGMDLGAVGLSLTAGVNCGNNAPLSPHQIPQPLETETAAKGAAEGITQGPLTPSGTSTKSSSGATPDPPPSFGSTEFVQATAVPYGLADTSYAPLDGAGVFTVAGMRSRAWSGVVKGERVAGATSDIGSLGLVNTATGPLVKLNGLHWEATFPSGGSTKPSGSFSIGQVIVNGTALPLGDDLSAVQSAINQVLGKVGVEVVLPDVSLVRGVETVSALQLLVVRNDARDNLLGLVTIPAQGPQQTLLGGLEHGFPGAPASVAKVTCPTDVPITVGEVVIASFTGGGYFSSGFGGVNATSGDVKNGGFRLNRFGLALPGQTTVVIPGTAGVPGSVGAPSNAAPSGGTAEAIPSTTGSGGTAIAAAPAAAHNSAAGPLLGVGLAGLALLALLVEGDRRKMRRALRASVVKE
ncbi:MAG: hypothetical protein ACYDH6_00855 [Acidimicrobiales bacterium]